MKIYVISDDEEKGAHVYSIASKFGNNVTLCPSFYTDYQSMVKEISKQEGVFDIIFVVTKSAIAISVELNKVEWIRAAICNNPNDAAEAKKADSNIFILNPSLLTKTNSEEILKSSLGEEQKTAQPTQENLKNTKTNSKINKAGRHLQLIPKRKDVQKDSEQENDYEQKLKKRSFRERIKFSLGFED